MKQRTFFVGLTLIAIVIGLLTGLSYSPVVGVIIPLIFTLVTAGGAYFHKGEKPSGGLPIADPTVYGIGLILFSLGFVFGGYFGVSAKLHWQTVWMAKPSISFPTDQIRDFRLLAVALELDSRMEIAGVTKVEREQIFAALFQSLSEREKARQAKVASEKRALKKIGEGELATLKQSFESLLTEVDAAYQESDDFDDETFIRISELAEQLRPMLRIDLIEEIEFLEYEVTAGQEKAVGSGLLSEDEVDAIKSLIPNYSTSSSVSKGFRAIASDDRGINLFEEG